MVGAVSYDIKNDREFNALLGKISKIGLNRFVMGESARIIKKFSKANFTLQGSGQYPPLSERYAQRKARMKPSAPILVYSGKLKDSIVGVTSDSINIIGDSFLVIGTKLPYAKYLDEGTSKMPARKRLFLTEKMVKQIMKVYTAHIDKSLKSLS
jgi:phage gpG-like protein